jgi:hypothetical protein
MSATSQPHEKSYSPKQELFQSQQIRLFRHLSTLLCRLCERVSWDELESAEKRRLRRTIAALSTCINIAQIETKAKSNQARQTTKAAFRKR